MWRNIDYRAYLEDFFRLQHGRFLATERRLLQQWKEEAAQISPTDEALFVYVSLIEAVMDDQSETVNHQLLAKQCEINVKRSALIEWQSAHVMELELLEAKHAFDSMVALHKLDESFNRFLAKLLVVDAKARNGGVRRHFCPQEHSDKKNRI